MRLFFRFIIILFLVVGVAFKSTSLQAAIPPQEPVYIVEIGEITYSDYRVLLDANSIESVIISQKTDWVYIKTKDGNEHKVFAYFSLSTANELVDKGVKVRFLKSFAYRPKSDSNQSFLKSDFMNFVPAIGFFFFMMILFLLGAHNQRSWKRWMKHENDRFLSELKEAIIEGRNGDD